MHCKLYGDEAGFRGRNVRVTVVFVTGWLKLASNRGKSLTTPWPSHYNDLLAPRPGASAVNDSHAQCCDYHRQK